MLTRALPLALLLASGCSESRPLDEPAQGGATGEAGAGPGAIEPAVWPGPAEVVTLDAPALFGGNLSGLTYEPAQGDTPATLWAVSNIPGKLYRLFESGDAFVPDAGWEQGKLLRYPGGGGEADAEGVTLAASLADGLYVVAEHDNEAPEVSRISVLRYDASATGIELTATHEWDLTSLLPPLAANLGAEAITWVPDDAGGLFVVGVEQTGMLYGFVLDHDASSATLSVSVATRYPGVVGLEYDREVGQLWVWCDDLCGNYASVFDIDGDGRFSERAWLEHPRGLPNSNNEGIALGSESECQEGLKPFFWTDDNDVNGQSLRRGQVLCGPQ